MSETKFKFSDISIDTATKIAIVAVGVYVAFAGLPFAAPVLSVKAITLPNIFGMTLDQIFYYLASDAVLGAALLFLFNYFKVPAQWSQVLYAVILAAVAAGLKAALNFVPTDILSTHLIDVLTWLVGWVSGLIGYHWAAKAQLV